MSPIITQPGAPAHAHPDEAARQRQDRLARATAGQAEAALAYLGMIDPLMFEIAMDAADLITGAAPRDEATGDEAVPVCRRCGAQVIYDPGHPVEVTWRLPGENPATA